MLFIIIVVLVLAVVVVVVDGIGNDDVVMSYVQSCCICIVYTSFVHSVCNHRINKIRGLMIRKSADFINKSAEFNFKSAVFWTCILSIYVW